MLGNRALSNTPKTLGQLTNCFAFVHQQGNYDSHPTRMCECAEDLGKMILFWGEKFGFG
jgi:hypothetical protein